VGPQEGEKASGGVSEAPPQPVAPDGVAEPRPAPGAGADALVGVTPAETTVVVPGASGGPQGALSSQKKAAPRARYVQDL